MSSKSFRNIKTKMTASTDKPATPKKKENDGKTKEEKINEIMADGATMVKMEVDYRLQLLYYSLMKCTFIAKLVTRRFLKLRL